MLNYQKLMNLNPTVLGSMTNSKNQFIEFIEHPIQGDESDVLLICRELQLAAHSGFYELDDMIAEHKEYEPSFELCTEGMGKGKGCLYIGEFLNIN